MNLKAVSEKVMSPSDILHLCLIIRMLIGFRLVWCLWYVGDTIEKRGTTCWHGSSSTDAEVTDAIPVGLYINSWGGRWSAPVLGRQRIDDWRNGAQA
eukprot:3441917-Amphidinium_carterae.3